MKKLLEVLQYGETDIRFNTDIDVTKNPDQMITIASSLLMTMVTDLWGGNEQSVIAVIRALTIADLAASVNTNEMADLLKKSANVLKSSFEETRKHFEKHGGKVITFAPGVGPSNIKN